MSFNEGDTRTQLIDPKLNTSGWTRSQVTREHYYRPDWEFTARQIAPQPPVVIGGALIIPAGLLNKLEGKGKEAVGLFGSEGRDAVEQIAMQAVMGQECSLGYAPMDVSAAKLGWDIESHVPGIGKLCFIEVKGRIEGATTITVSKNEILAGLNKPEDYILAVGEIKNRDGNLRAGEIRYLRKPFEREPDFAAASVNYELRKMTSK
jgi:hypothetical protein